MVRANSVVVTADLLRLALWQIFAITSALHSFLPQNSSAFSDSVLISHRDLPGKLLFNASLGWSNWTYHVDYFRSSQNAVQYIYLDSTKGHIYLKTSPSPCPLLTLNSQKVFITARQHHSTNLVLAKDRDSETTNIISNSLGIYTVTPINVYIHIAKHCYRKHRRKVELPSSLLVIADSNLEHGACILPNKAVLTLKQFMPAEYLAQISSKNCRSGFIVVGSTDFLVHNITSVVSAVNEVCMAGGQITIRGEILASNSCGTDSDDKAKEKDDRLHRVLPFSVVLHKASPHLQEQDMNVVGTGDAFRSRNRHMRLRRAVTNTRPQFTQRSYEKHVEEEQASGMLVATITATDTDSGDAGRLTYALQAAQDGRSRTMFAIDPITGRINTTKKLDRETIKAHYFNIIVSDYGLPPESATASLTIHVDDVNDHPPKKKKVPTATLR